MKKLISLIILAFLLMPSFYAQYEDAEIFRDRTRTPLTCSSSSSILFAGPGRTKRRIKTLPFGEIVQRAGQKAYVGAEKRTYIKVKTESGQKGWVNEFHFVKNGIPAIVQNKSRIYLSPRNNAAITQDYFHAGERVLLGTISGDWIELFSENKSKGGWIQGANRVSAKQEQLASNQLNKRTGARTYHNNSGTSYGSSDNSDRNIAQKSRGGQDFYPNSVLASRNQGITRGEVVGNLNALLRPQYANEGRQYNNTYQSFASAGGARKTQGSYRNSSNRAIRKRVTEEGRIYTVNLPNDDGNLFVGYHKSLPVGSKVQIPFPDNPGFIEIEIIGSLRSQRPEVIGLYPACVSLIYGNQVPRQIKFSYLAKN